MGVEVLLLVVVLFLLFKALIFLEQFEVHRELRGRYKGFPYASCPFYMQVFLLSNVPTSPEGTLVIVDEPILAHHNHQKSVIYLRVSLLVLYILWMWTDI